MDEDAWFTVGKPKKPKTGELKQLKGEFCCDCTMHFIISVFPASEELEFNENLKLIISMNINNTEKSTKTNGTNKENVMPAKKKTQIPIKIKPARVAKQSASPPRKPIYKSLQAALAAINVNELESLLEASNLQFKNDVIQLKTALEFLNDNTKVSSADESIWCNQPFDYPNNLMPSALRVLLKELVQQCSNETLQYFFHNVLRSLCEETNRSRNFIGHLMMLQQITQHYPEVSLSQLASTVILKNSYLNQQAICCNLLWVLETSAMRDVNIGIKIWMELVSSVVNIKTYTKFAYELLLRVLSSRTRLILPPAEYKLLANLLLANYEPKAKPKELQRLKAKIVELLTEKFAAGTDPEQVGQAFLMLLAYSKRQPELFAKGLMAAVCVNPQDCTKIWRLQLDINLRQTVSVFRHIGEFN